MLFGLKKFYCVNWTSDVCSFIWSSRMLGSSFDWQVSNENKFPGIELFIFHPLVTLCSRGQLQPIWNSSENLIATAGKALLSISEKLARYLPHGHSKPTRSIAKSFSMLEHRVDARHGKFGMKWKSNSMGNIRFTNECCNVYSQYVSAVVSAVVNLTAHERSFCSHCYGIFFHKRWLWVNKLVTTDCALKKIDLRFWYAISHSPWLFHISSLICHK